MFYCDTCKNKNHWPCEKDANCYDIPSGALPLPDPDNYPQYKNLVPDAKEAPVPKKFETPHAALRFLDRNREKFVAGMNPVEQEGYDGALDALWEYVLTGDNKGRL